MSEMPPSFAQYPRSTPSFGDAAHLKNLADGYFGLNTIFIVNIVIALATRLISSSLPKSDPLGNLTILGGIAFVVAIVIGLLTYGPNKKIGAGANWSPSQPILASVLMGINSALCCGVVGYIVMQTIAKNHMKNYGVTGGFFGIKKAEVERRINEMQGL